MAKTVAEKKARAAIDQLDGVRGEWLRRPGVTGVDIGFKIRGEKLTDEVALRVHVERKLPIEALEKREVFTKSERPEKIGGFPLDVIEATYAPAQVATVELEGLEDAGRTERVDPLIAGISVGNPRVTAGTLGSIVWDRASGLACVLSNWHVLAGSSDAAAGEPIYQPGPIDGGTPSDTVATLTRSRLDSDMDAAIAALNGSRGYSRDVLGLNPILGIEHPALGMEVRKSGRTTGVTEGVIDGLSFSGAIAYQHGPTNTFHGQIHIVPRPPWPSVDYETSKGGDSGSVWIDQASGKAIGLHYGGELNPAPASEMALANPMYKVAAESGLNFSFSPVFKLPGLQPPEKPPWRDLPFDPRDIGSFDPRPPLTRLSGLHARGGPTPLAFAAPAPAEDGAREEAESAELDALIEQFHELVAELDRQTRRIYHSRR